MGSMSSTGFWGGWVEVGRASDVNPTMGGPAGGGGGGAQPGCSFVSSGESPPPIWLSILGLLERLVWSLFWGDRLVEAVMVSSLWGEWFGAAAYAHLQSWPWRCQYG
eukprot:scaffold16232_cov126-Isochrysis_galbana.AAC.3